MRHGAFARRVAGKFYFALLLAPPLLWLGIVYLGSLLHAAAAELLRDRRIHGARRARRSRSRPTGNWSRKPAHIDIVVRTV
jgi:hypothetical protein